MKFRLTTVLWVFAVLASAMATFGGWPGLFWAWLVFMFWGWIFNGRRLTMVEGCLVIVIVLVLCALLLPAVQVARESARRAQCQHHLKWIALALHFHEESHGSWPSAAIVGPDDQLWHSWRLQVLPYLEQKPLFDQYDPNQPWDGPKNKVVATTLLYCYLCPSDPDAFANTSLTNYFAVVGDNTMWPEGRGRRSEEVTDQLNHTILLLEAGGKSVSWAEPQDFTFEEAVEFLTSEKHGTAIHVRSAVRPGFFYKPHYETSGGVHAAFADGSVRFLPVPMGRELAVALLTCNGGETVDGLDRLTEPQLDYGRIWGFCVFVLLALAPLRKRLAKQRASEQAVS